MVTTDDIVAAALDWYSAECEWYYGLTGWHQSPAAALARAEAHLSRTVAAYKADLHVAPSDIIGVAV